MYVKISLLILLSYLTCIGEEKLIIPTAPMDLPVFYWLTNKTLKHPEAATKAQEAFLIQTGAMQEYNSGKNFVMKRVNAVTQKRQKQVAEYIDKETPLNSKAVFFVVGSSYTLMVRKHVTKEFGNPLYQPLRHTITLDVKNKGVFTGIKVPF